MHHSIAHRVLKTRKQKPWTKRAVNLQVPLDSFYFLDSCKIWTQEVIMRWKTGKATGLSKKIFWYPECCTAMCDIWMLSHMWYMDAQVGQEHVPICHWLSKAGTFLDRFLPAFSSFKLSFLWSPAKMWLWKLVILRGISVHQFNNKHAQGM